MKLIKLTAISAAVLASTAALAAEPVAVVQPANSYSDRTFFQTVTHPAAVSAEVGTLGYGANIGWSLTRKLNYKLVGQVATLLTYSAVTLMQTM